MIEHIQLTSRGRLHRDFRVGIKVEIFTQQRHTSGLILRFIQVSRRTAAPVKLADMTVCKQRRAMANFLLKRVKILVSFMLLAGDNLLQPQK